MNSLEFSMPSCTMMVLPTSSHAYIATKVLTSVQQTTRRSNLLLCLCCMRIAGTVLQVQSILKPTQGVTWSSGKPENEGGHGAIFLDE